MAEAMTEKSNLVQLQSASIHSSFIGKLEECLVKCWQVDFRESN